MMSNILKVFNPPTGEDLGGSRSNSAIPTDEDCLPCTAIQSIVALGGGVYFSSQLPFRDNVTGKIDLIKHPLWWQKSVRGFGILVFGLGAYRAGEVIQILWRRKFD
ncbi:uncharacterized protein RJT21DRAFT_12305 [Scheffersomyces amazonensis]|uniref:uncharacterized protein n=1 Tax=Scheffersomyces amazonensis TaxID=1078765 RepID=UPI00315CCE6E